MSTELVTVRQIACAAGVEMHKVIYVIRSMGLSPAERVGQARVFDQATSQMIAAKLRDIASTRRGGAGK